MELSPPWVQYAREVNELFKNDKDIGVRYDEEAKEVILKVKTYEKTKALKRILPDKKTFGNVELKINIEYSEHTMSLADAYKAAFENNPVFKRTYMSDNGISYIVFKREVVQYWNDDTNDPNGVTSTLYKDIANNVFDNRERIIFSTDSEAKQDKHCATPEEIEEWEKYNGKGSFAKGYIVKAEKPVSVKDEKTFKSIFTMSPEELPF